MARAYKNKKWCFYSGKRNRRFPDIIDHDFILNFAYYPSISSILKKKRYKVYRNKLNNNLYTNKSYKEMVNCIFLSKFGYWKNIYKNKKYKIYKNKLNNHKKNKIKLEKKYDEDKLINSYYNWKL